MLKSNILLKMENLMDLLERPEKESVSSILIIGMLATASFVLYMITYYVIESNPLLPLQFDFETYALCLIITMVIVSIPSLIAHKMRLN
jgi:hypothetical protein